MSGYAPIKDASNTTVAILGVDMNADAVVANQGFIGGTIYYVMAVGIIIAGTIIYFFSHPLVEDINKLRDASEKLAKGENIAKLDIRRTDEVGELANSFDKISILLAADRGINEESNRKD
jgi:HAMP domain-containing protein